MKKALKIYENLFDENHQYISQTYKDIADIYKKKINSEKQAADVKFADKIEGKSIDGVEIVFAKIEM